MINNNYDLKTTYFAFLEQKPSKQVTRLINSNSVSKKHKGLAFGITSGSLLLIGIVSTLVFHKNVKSLASKLRLGFLKIEERQQILDKKIQEMGENAKVDKSEVFVLKTASYLNKKIKGLVSFYTNIDPVRNYFLGIKATNKVKPIQKFANKITEFLGKTVEKTARQNYKKVSKSFAIADKNLTAFITELKKFPELNPKIEQLEKQAQELKKQISNLTEGFDKTRLQELHKKMESFVVDYDNYYREKLPENFKDVFKNLKEITEESMDNYIAGKISRKHTADWIDGIVKQKFGITRELSAKTEKVEAFCDSAKDSLFDAFVVKNNINFKKYMLDISELKKIIKEYVKETDKLKKYETEQTFNNKLKELIEKIKTEKISEEEKLILEEAVKNLQKIQENMSNIDKGIIEEIRFLMKDVKGKTYEKTYVDLKKSLKTLSKDVNNATNFETDNMEGRLRDLALGGGVFELLSMVVPTGILAGSVINSENRDERISKSLKLGLPLVGGMGTMIYTSLVKAFNGPKAILIGLGTGFVFNKIGVIINSMRKKTDIKNELNNEKFL